MLEHHFDPGRLTCPGSDYLSPVSNSSNLSRKISRLRHNSEIAPARASVRVSTREANLVPTRCGVPQFEPHEPQVAHMNTTSARSHNYAASVVSLPIIRKSTSLSKHNLRDFEYSWDSYKSHSTLSIPRTLPNYQVELFPAKKMESHTLFVEEIGTSASKSDENSSEASLKHRLANIFGKQDKKAYLCKSDVTQSSHASKKKSKTSEKRHEVVTASSSLCYPDDSFSPSLAFPSAEKIIFKYTRPRSSSYPPQQHTIPEDTQRKLIYKPKANPQLKTIGETSPATTRIPAAGMPMESSSMPYLYQKRKQSGSKPTTTAYRSYENIFHPANNTELTRRNTISNTPADMRQFSHSIGDLRGTEVHSNLGFSGSEQNMSMMNCYSQEQQTSNDIDTDLASQTIDRFFSFPNPNYPPQKTAELLFFHPTFQKACGFFIVFLATQTIVVQLRAISWSLATHVQSFAIIVFILLMVAGLYSACEDGQIFKNLKEQYQHGTQTRLEHRPVPYTEVLNDFANVPNPVHQQYMSADPNYVNPSTLKTTGPTPMLWKFGNKLVKLTSDQKREIELELLKNNSIANAEYVPDGKVKKKLRFNLNS